MGKGDARTEIGSDWAMVLDPDVVNLTSHTCRRFSIPTEFSAVFTDSGRTALRVAIRSLGLGQGDAVLLPAYLCWTVVEAFTREGVRPIFYSVGEGFRTSLNDILERGRHAKAVLVVDFFGFHSDLRRHLSDLRAEGLQIIYDVSHSLIEALTNPLGHVDAYVASLRKVLPVPDGGVTLLRDADEGLRLAWPTEPSAHAWTRIAAMILKEAWFRQPSTMKPGFREMALEAEALLDKSSTIGGLSPVTRTLLPLFDLDYLAARRRENYAMLAEFSRDWPSGISCPFGLPDDSECPLGFPILTKRRNVLRKFLIAHRVFPPVHWVLDRQLFRDFPVSLYISERILTIPCDHRYASSDMKFIDQVVSKWGELIG